jgi:hypothetical protein
VSVFTPSNPLLQVSAGLVIVDAVAFGDVQALKTNLEALGMRGAVAFGRIVSGYLPIAAIEGAAVLASLQFARPAMPPPALDWLRAKVTKPCVPTWRAPRLVWTEPE